MNPEDMAREYHDSQAQVARATSLIVSHKWDSTVTVGDLDNTVETFAFEAALAVGAGQMIAVQKTDVFAANYLFVATDTLHLPVGVDPVDFLGPSQTDAPLRALLRASKVYVRDLLANNRSDIEALTFGRYRATRLAYSETMEAGRQALAEVMSDRPEIRGWKRAVSAKACPICLGLADGSIQPWDRRVAAHPHCSCTATPVVSTAQPITAEETR